MTKKRKDNSLDSILSDEDRALFLQAVHGVLPPVERKKAQELLHETVVKEEENFAFLLDSVPSHVMADALREKAKAQHFADKVVKAKKQKDFDGRLDLHAARRHVAIDRLRHFIEVCQNKGHLHVLVVHGKGSGALQEEVYAYLAKDGRVIAFQCASQKDGGSGAVELWLKGKGKYVSRNDNSGGTQR